MRTASKEGSFLSWDPKVGFDGALSELFEIMAPFYPGVKAVSEVQNWLLKRAKLEDETFICRKHAGVPRGHLVPGSGANPYLASDNEFATSVFGLTWSGNIARLTSGSMLDALALPGVKLCWAFGATPEEKQAVLRSHTAAARPLRVPLGGTSIYRPRGEQRLKLAHFTPAAEQIGALSLDERARRRLRMFRSVDPLNMYPLPQAGARYDHSAEWRGAKIPLQRHDLGETAELLSCLIALLEERYRAEGHPDDFIDYASAAQLDLASLDLPALRTKSAEIHVRVTPKGSFDKHSRADAMGLDVLHYEAFKGWAVEIVRQYGDAPSDFFACGEPCKSTLRGGASPLVYVRFDGFDDDHGEYNSVYRVARDTRVSALACFLLLDRRHHGDCNAVFRPDVSRTGGSLKPLLNVAEADVYVPIVPHLSLYSGEVKGWNLLSRDSIR